MLDLPRARGEDATLTSTGKSAAEALIESLSTRLPSLLYSSSTNMDYDTYNDPPDYSILEREEYRWLQETNNTTTSSDDNANSSGNNALATFSAVGTNLLLFFLIFCLSASVNLKDLRRQLTNKVAIGTGVAMQFILMPLLGFLSILIFNRFGYSQAMGVSLMVVTASPGGSYSNWWCSLFNASLALSVGMTSVSSLLSIGLLPANLFLYGWLAYGVIIDGDDVNIVESLDFGAIFITLGVVMGAIIAGLFVGYKCDNATFHRRANYVGSICGISLIIFSAFLGSGVDGADTNFWSLPWSFYVATAFPCAAGMSVANLVSRSFKLPYPEVVAISIECCYQNTAIATSVAVTMFTNPTQRAEAVSVPLFYGVVEAAIIGVYCIWAWKAGWTKAPADEKLCVVMIKTYEFQDGEADDQDDLEFDPEEIDELSWWQKCFVPRYPDHSKKQMSVSQESKSRENMDVEPRNRFYSSDVTVSTNITTPPGTPVATQSNSGASLIEEDPESGVAATSKSIACGTFIAVIDEGEDSSNDESPTPRMRLSGNAFVQDLQSKAKEEDIIEAMAAITDAPLFEMDDDGEAVHA